MQISNLEMAALIAALAGLRSTAVSSALLEQGRRARVVKRDRTSVGFYTDLDCTDSPPLLGSETDSNSARFCAHADHPNGRDRLDFIVYLGSGRLSYFEAASTGEWPDDESGIGAWSPG
jgi:hypothetical protein